MSQTEQEPGAGPPEQSSQPLKVVGIGASAGGLKALQDWDCFLRIAQLGPIAFEPEPLVIQRFSGNSLTKTTRNRAHAQAAIIEKHREALEKAPRRLAEYFHQIGSIHRRNGDFALAWRAFRASLRHHPARIKAWAGLARLALSRVHRV